MSKDPKVLQASFGQALLSGGLHTIKAGGADRPDAIKAFNGQIKKSIATYCQKNRRPLADFDPFNEANANPDFLAAVLQEVSGRQEWAAKKDAENGAPLMEGISLLREHMAESAGKKDDTGNPEFSTKQLFEAVLELPVYEVKPPAPGSNQWIRRHTTLRKSTEERLAARNAQEDADTDVELEDTEKAHLGTLDFVQLMMEPSAVDPSYNPLDPDQFHARFEGLADRAEELRIDPDEWEKKQDNAGVRLADRKPPPGVYLGTIHSTKGAEWEDVTLLMPKGIFPLQKKPRKPKDNEVPEEPIYDAESELESERRLGYVALTRPKKSLTIMSTGGISPFVAEAGLHVGQNVPRPETETPNAVPATPGEADKAMADEAASEGPPEEDHPDEEEHPSPLSHNASHSESRDSFKSFINRLAKANVKYTYHRGDS
jgi:superfamily I DNA/RNA helicase